MVLCVCVYQDTEIYSFYLHYLFISHAHAIFFMGKALDELEMNTIVHIHGTNKHSYEDKNIIQTKLSKDSDKSNGLIEVMFLVCSRSTMRT